MYANMRVVKVNATLAVLLLLFASVAALRAVVGPDMTWKYEKVLQEAGTLHDVIATAGDDVWAAGDGFLLHDDGTGWQRRPVPASLGDSVHRARFDAADTGGFLMTASRTNGHTQGMAYWDGTRWAALPQLPDDGRVMDVRAFASDDIWVLADWTGAHHWDGTRWTAMDLPVTVTALDGVSSDDLWAVGHHYPDGPDEGLGTPGAQPAAVHWNGRTWKLVPTPEYRHTTPAPEQLAHLTEVVALAKDDIRAYGKHTSISEDDEPDPPEEDIRLRWNGTGWLKLPNSKGACSDRGRWIRDGERGVVLGAGRYLTADGNCQGIGLSEPPGTGATKPDSRQSLRLNAITAVPGTDDILGVGAVGDLPVIVALQR
ncbi:hypothetical protein [Streptomyces sp. DH24]|uniref:hypothetical protein n=1 Tax=Streptomyces sp. DH24 TaxID=3040123 RepID=UPI0024420609|nr:hypothetical protein [Streptomyces sp. DH24]MDG9719621.1 hypothetical protein [Streptomyces sp. DH24]